MVKCLKRVHSGKPHSIAVQHDRDYGDWRCTVDHHVDWPLALSPKKPSWFASLCVHSSGWCGHCGVPCIATDNDHAQIGIGLGLDMAYRRDDRGDSICGVFDCRLRILGWIVSDNFYYSNSLLGFHQPESQWWERLTSNLSFVDPIMTFYFVLRTMEYRA